MTSPDSHLFFFTDPATPEIYTLSLHDALPICGVARRTVRRARRRPASHHPGPRPDPVRAGGLPGVVPGDRKSTRLTSHTVISYAVFCLKKKKKRTESDKKRHEILD